MDLARCLCGVLAGVITGNWVLCELAHRDSRLEAEMPVLALVPVGSEPPSSSPPGHHLSPFNATQELFTNILMRKLASPYLSSARARSQIWHFNNNQLTDGLFPRVQHEAGSKTEPTRTSWSLTSPHQVKVQSLNEALPAVGKVRRRCLHPDLLLPAGRSSVRLWTWQGIKAGGFDPPHQPHPLMLTWISSSWRRRRQKEARWACAQARMFVSAFFRGAQVLIHRARRTFLRASKSRIFVDGKPSPEGGSRRDTSHCNHLFWSAWTFHGSVISALPETWV